LATLPNSLPRLTAARPKREKTRFLKVAAGLQEKGFEHSPGYAGTG
jgi:hypothetical protein